MLMHLSSWPEIDARLNDGGVLSRTAIVPIGSNEQHGPTGLLGTDWLCPEIIAHAAEGTEAGLLVGGEARDLSADQEELLEGRQPVLRRDRRPART